MPKTILTDEKMYAALETVITIIAQHLLVGDEKKSSFPDKEILTALLEQEYSPKAAWAFLRAGYWHLANEGVMIVDQFNRYYLTEKIGEDKKEDLCMNIFSRYETYLQASFAYSLHTPNHCQMSEKGSNSSSKFKLK